MVRKPSKLFRKGDPFFEKVDHRFLNSIERRLAKLENMSSGTGFNKLLGGGASKSALGVRLDNFEIVALAESLPPFGMANAYYVRHYDKDDSYDKVAIGSNTWSSSGVEKFVIDLTNTIEVHNLCDVEYSANELGFSPVMPRGEERLNIFIPICPAEISSSSSTTSTSGVDSSSSSSSSSSESSSSSSSSSSGADSSSSSSSSSSSTSSSTSTSGVDESSSSSSGIEVRKCFTVVTAVSFNSDTCELIVDTCDLCFPADLNVTLENCSASSSSSGGS